METSEKGVKIMQDQTLNRRTFLAALGACAWPVLGEAQSADWPARLVRIITPAPAGGSTDRMARTLANEYAKALGQPFVIDNKPGAGGSIGTAAAAVAAADGYTLLMSGVFNSITPALYAQLPFNYLEDFEHIAPLFYGPNVLVVRADFPHDTLAKLVAAAKSSAKDPLYFASSGVGTSGHLTMEMFQRAAGITLMHVPYKGGAPALQDVLSGQVSMQTQSPGDHQRRAQRGLSRRAHLCRGGFSGCSRNVVGRAGCAAGNARGCCAGHAYGHDANPEAAADSATL